MQDGKITIYIKANGASYSLNISPEENVSTLKTEVMALIDPIYKQYKDFECLEMRLPHFTFGGKQLEDHQGLREYNIKDQCTISVSHPIGLTKAQQKIVCTTHNLVFTTFMEYRKDEETVGSLKQKLSQFVGLSCTTLSLKKKGLQEFLELENDSLVIPLRDVYAQFEGALAIQAPTSHIQFYQGETSVFASMAREAEDENRDYSEKPKHPFSIPKEKDIAKIENANGEFFTHTKDQMNRKVRWNQSKQLFKPCGLLGSTTYLSMESISYFISSNTSDKTIASVLFSALGSGIISGALAVGANYVYETYYKTQADQGAQRG